MRPVECEFEADVLAAVLQSRWPERVDSQLRSHAADCAICSDVAAVAGVIDAARDQMRTQVTLPDSGRVWWHAQLRARREAVRTAARPITATQMLAGACAVGLTGACFGATSAWFQTALRSAFAGFDVAALVAEHSLLALAMGAVLFLVPAAAWLATRKE